MQNNYDLLAIVKESFDRQGFNYIETIQNKHLVLSTSLLKSKNAMYCYVLYEDKSHLNPPANLVFRFRKNENIKSWFQKTKLNSKGSKWINRFNKMWAKDSSISNGIKDPEMVTGQYGILLSKEDWCSKEFEETIDLFVRIAVEAVKQASKRKSRDWAIYESMIR